MAQGFALVEVVRDGGGRVVDQRMLEIDPSTERFLGVTSAEACGRLVSEFLPPLERHALDLLNEVVTLGVPKHVDDGH